MDINYMSENIKLYDLSKAIKKTVSMEYEHVISDSKADVGAVLKGNAYVTDDNAVIENDMLKLKGKMNILICIRSVNGNIFSVHNVSEINEKMDVYANERAPVIISKVVVEKVDSRIINERKVAVKVRYTVYVDCNTDKEINIVSGLENGDNAEMMTEMVNIHAYNGCFMKDTDVTDTYLVPNDCPEVFELLYYEAALKSMDHSVTADGINVSGNVCFRLYYSFGDRGENMNYLENCASFNELIETNGMKVDKMFLNAKVANFVINAEQDSDGEYRLINSSAKISLAVLCFEETTVKKAGDVYGINNRLIPQVQSEVYSFPVKNSLSTCQISETVTLGMEKQVSEVLGMDAYAYVADHVYDDNGILTVRGSVPVSIIYKDANGEINVFSKEMPLRYEEKINIDSKMMVKVSTEQVSSGYNLLSGNEVDIRVNVSLAFVVYGSDSFSYINDIQVNEYSDDRIHASLVLHYCSGNETVWSISKKYHIHQKTLRQMNGLEDDDVSLEDGRQIIIPM